MTSEFDTAGGLEEQIQKQVDRTGGLVTGEFDEANAEGLIKYVVSVHQAVEHLESLCAPITDDEYLDNRPDSIANIGSKVQKENWGVVLEKSEMKYRYLIKLLYRRGVI